MVYKVVCCWPEGSYRYLEAETSLYSFDNDEKCPFFRLVISVFHHWLGLRIQNPVLYNLRCRHLCYITFFKLPYGKENCDYLFWQMILWSASFVRHKKLVWFSKLRFTTLYSTYNIFARDNFSVRRLSGQ